MHKKFDSSLAISFKEDDCEGVLYSHDDALVVTLLVANYTTRHILIDNGSSTDLPFREAIVKIGIDATKLRPSPMPLKGFSRDLIRPVGTITLLVKTGRGMCTTTTMTDYLIVKAPSSYIDVLG